MTTTNQTTASTADKLAEARRIRDELTSLHVAAKADADAARASLNALDADADQGRPVDADAYVSVSTDLRLKSRRAAALTGQVAEAEGTIRDLEKQAELDHIRGLAAAIPSTDKERAAVVKAFEKYTDALKARATAVDELFKAAEVLPKIDHPNVDGLDGWPCHTTRYSNGRKQYEGRMGHLDLGGQRYKRPYVPAEAESLAEDLRRSAGKHRHW